MAMKKLILLVLVITAVAGAFMAVRWFRGDTEYEDALHEFEEQQPMPDEGAPAAV
jgi:hypothetical protein